MATHLINSVAVFGFCLLASSANADETLTKARALFKALPESAQEASQLDPIDQNRIDLGRALYFDPRLSASGTHSCNSCHNLALGGDDNRADSVGHGWQSAPRNAPSILNSVFNEARFWDGTVANLERRAMGPVRTGVELSNTVDQIERTIGSMPQYVDWFAAAFPNEAGPVSFENTARAIEAFKTTLITPSRFDSYLNGEEGALSPEEIEGLALFIDKGCAVCHNGINFGGHDYYPFGVFEDPDADAQAIGYRARFVVTETVVDDRMFRAAPLRNVALTAPYFHAGSVWELEAAVGIMADTQLGEEMTDLEVSKITAFLKSLTGTFIPLEYPLLPVETSTTPRPSEEVLPY